MLSGFKEGQFVTSLLATLARVPAFRVSIIEQDPAILERLLNLSDIDEMPNAELDAHSLQLASLILLSQPLPSSAALPASIHGFMQQLLERMTRDQDVNSIRAVFQVLCGQSTDLLEVVSPEIVERFATACNKILRNNADHMRNVLCLAIYALLAREIRTSSLSSSSSSSKTTRPSVFVEQWRNSTKKFFVGERAFKTASLTVIRVLHFCSQDRQIPTEEALEGLQLCAHIVKAIDRTAIIQWTGRNETVLRRLEEKLSSGRIQREMALAVRLITIKAENGL